MNKEQIFCYLGIYLDETGEYEFTPSFNPLQQGQLQWIKIERVR